jgi:hypothetical protein
VIHLEMAHKVRDELLGREAAPHPVPGRDNRKKSPVRRGNFTFHLESVKSGPERWQRGFSQLSQILQAKV